MKYRGKRDIVRIGMMVTVLLLALLTGIAGSRFVSLPQEVAARTQVRVASLRYLGVSVPVRQGNMSVKTAPSEGAALTWGGQPRLDVADNQSTHIIGHNTGRLGGIIRLKKGMPITVTDVNGRQRVYHVVRIANVTDRGLDLATGINVFRNIVSQWQGEQIVLQTCLSGTLNRLVWAR